MSNNYSSEALKKVIESAKRMNVELDEKEAVGWLESIRQASGDENEITFDERTGVFGQNIAMLDFSPERLNYYRKIGKLVEFLDVPDRVETALQSSALSGRLRLF